MRPTIAMAALVALAACAGFNAGQDDPHLYDANGDVLVAAPPPAALAAPRPDCREARRTVTIGGQAKTAVGIACRQPDGAWRLVD